MLARSNIGTEYEAIEACLASHTGKAPRDAAPYTVINMAISLALPGAAITRAAWKAALSFEREDRESRAKDVGRIVGRILGLFMWTITDLGEAKTKGRQQVW
ncbi:hypothetical protein TrVGV298_003172 [Trichoderma virens]|nr:hypothetical protein TrVGV298_003172 [Trichoderma virens]